MTYTPRVRLAVTLLLGFVVGLGVSFVLSENRNYVGGWGHDFSAFLHASLRWSTGEGMYWQDLLEAPIASVVGGAYLYPPTLALIIAPSHVLGFDLATMLWGGLQQVFLVAAILIAARAGGGQHLRAIEISVLVALPVIFWPLMWLLKEGNIGGLLALLAALSLRRSFTGGIAIAVAVAIKVVALTALPAAILAGPRMRVGLLVGLLVFAIADLSLAPDDSIAFPRVMLNLAAGDTNNQDNLALGQTLSLIIGAGSASVGRVVSLALLALLTTISVFAAWRSRHMTAMSAALWASLFVSGTIWPHYLVIALVPVAAAWPSSGRLLRLLSLVAMVSLLANLWLPPGPVHVLTTAVMVWLMASTSWVLWRSETPASTTRSEA